jgi:hypothetical protein
MARSGREWGFRTLRDGPKITAAGGHPQPVAAGEVDEGQDAVHHSVAHSDAGLEAARGQGVAQLLQESEEIHPSIILKIWRALATGRQAGWIIYLRKVNEGLGNLREFYSSMP